MEHPYFFDGNGASLFGVLHTPESRASSHAFVLCHPLAEEKLWSQRVLVNLARDLCARGHSVLRFDFRGHGDSSGDSLDYPISTYVDDLHVARTLLESAQENIETVNLVGLRLGATIAFEYAAKIGEVASCILWEPIVNGEKYVQELLRINLSTQLSVYGKVLSDRNALLDQIRSGELVNVDGYLLSKSIVEDLLGLPQMALNRIDPDVNKLVLQISRGAQQADRDDYRSLITDDANASFAKVQEQPFWREGKHFVSRGSNVIDHTVAWWTERYE